jgi:hypothetical protein
MSSLLPHDTADSDQMLDGVFEQHQIQLTFLHHEILNDLLQLRWVVRQLIHPVLDLDPFLQKVRKSDTVHILDVLPIVTGIQLL